MIYNEYFDIKILNNGLNRYLIYKGNKLAYKRAYKTLDMAKKWAEKVVFKSGTKGLFYKSK